MTSDERREVAERLRELASSDATRYAEPFCEQLTDIVDFPFDGTNKLSNVADNLADLIDPTCKDMVMHREDAFVPGKKACDGYFRCSRCNFNGRVFESIGFGDMATTEIRYCPNCRARVVRGDD